jgi:hypothetical protein
LLVAVGYLAWPPEPEPRGQFAKVAWGWGPAVMDRHLAAVEGGADPISVRTQADETVRGISKTLRDRAAGGPAVSPSA